MNIAAATAIIIQTRPGISCNYDSMILPQSEPSRELSRSQEKFTWKVKNTSETRSEFLFTAVTGQWIWVSPCERFHFAHDPPRRKKKA